MMVSWGRFSIRRDVYVYIYICILYIYIYEPGGVTHLSDAYPYLGK